MRDGRVVAADHAGLSEWSTLRPGVHEPEHQRGSIARDRLWPGHRLLLLRLLFLPLFFLGESAWSSGGWVGDLFFARLLCLLQFFLGESTFVFFWSLFVFFLFKPCFVFPCSFLGSLHLCLFVCESTLPSL